MFETLIISTMIIAIIINIVLAIFSFMNKKTYAMFLGQACLYDALVVLFYVFSILFDSKLVTSIFSSLYFICMDLMVISLFLFIYWLSEDKKTKPFKVIISLICLIGMVDIILLIVNIFVPIVIDYEKVYDVYFISTYKYVPKFLFKCHLIYVYVIVVLSLFDLIKKSIYVPSQYKSKYLIVFVGIIVCAIINLLFLLIPQKITNPNLVAAFNVDYALLGYSILAVFCCYAALVFPEKGMLNKLKTKIFDSLNQGLVLFDYNDNMILYNKKAISYLGKKNTMSKPPLNEFRKNCDLIISNIIDEESFSIQCIIKNEQEKPTPLRCDYRCIKDKYGKTIGKLFVFADAQLETDLLTGFHNWDSFKNFATDNKNSFPCNTGVAIVDINRLNLYNSLHGKSEGDRVLKDLSLALKETFSIDSYYVKGNNAALIAICYNKSEEEILNELAKIKDNFEVSIQYSSSSIKDDNDTILNAIIRGFDSLHAKKIIR